MCVVTTVQTVLTYVTTEPWWMTNIFVNGWFFIVFYFLVNAYCLHLVFEAVVWSSSGLFMVIPYSVIAYIFIDCGECEIKHDHLLWDTPTSSRMKLLLPFSKRINYIKSESNVFKFLNVNSANNRSANSRFDSNSIVLSNLNHRIR